MKFKTPNKLLLLALFAYAFSFANTSAQTLEDVNQVYSKTVAKILTNAAGNLYSTDTLSEFTKANRADTTVYVAITHEEPGTTTQTFEVTSQTKIFAKVTDFKNKIEMVQKQGTIEYAMNGVKLPTYSYFDNVYKYIAGNVSETYLSTQKSNNANQKNVVNSIESKLQKKGLPTALRNTIVNKIYSSQYIKLNRAESLSSLDSLLGLAPDENILENVNTSKIKDTFMPSIGTIFKIKEDKGLEKFEYEYSPNVWSSQKATKSYVVRKLILRVDTNMLADYAIKKNASSLLTTDIVGASTESVQQLMQKLYGELTIEVLIDAKTYDIRSIYVPLYEISYTEDGVKDSMLFEAVIEEGPTGLTTISAPKKFITPKTIRNYYLKY